jgi:hypothetical protein
VRTVLATPNDRLALVKQTFGDTDHAPSFEAEVLAVIEVDSEGRIAACVHFDPHDRRAASLELLERSARLAPPWVPQAVFELARGTADRDLARCRAALPDDFVFDDHRRTGLGRLEGADAYVASLAALFEQSPDVIMESLYTIARERHGQLWVGRTFGTLVDGGEFEIVSNRLQRFEAGQLAGFEIFEPEDLDRARARFEELCPDPLRIPPNAASPARTRDRALEALAAQDWAALRALTTEDFRFEDRGKQSLVSGGVEPYIESLQFLTSEGGRFAFDLIGTAGERVAIERVMVTDANGSFEIEQISVQEVGADGKQRAVIRFEADDRRAAFEEAQARFLAGEAAGVRGQAPIAALDPAFTRHDWETVRACLTEDAVFRDRRAVGVLGTLDRDEWVESLRTLADLAPDVDAESFRILSWNDRGRVDLARSFGTREGGAFENRFARVFVTHRDRVQRVEFFDIDAADAALARFAELCADLEGTVQPA